MNIALQNDEKCKYWDAIDCAAQGAICDELEAARKWIQAANPKISARGLEAYSAGFAQGFNKGVDVALKLAAKA